MSRPTNARRHKKKTWTPNIPWEGIESFLTELGERAGAFMRDNPGIPLGAMGDGAQEIFHQIREWSTHLTASALGKWPPNVLRGAPCGIIVGEAPCGNLGIARCDICGSVVCLAHCRIDYQADAICAGCISVLRHARGQTSDVGPGFGPRRAAREAERPTSPQAEVDAAYEALGLEPGTPWGRVRRQYRRLASLHNADRPQSDAERHANTERMKVINRAYAVLREHLEEAA